MGREEGMTFPNKQEKMARIEVDWERGGGVMDD